MDPPFEVHLGTRLRLHRIVEHCQWKEVFVVSCFACSINRLLLLLLSTTKSGLQECIVCLAVLY